MNKTSKSIKAKQLKVIKLDLIRNLTQRIQSTKQHEFLEKSTANTHPLKTTHTQAALFNQ